MVSSLCFKDLGLGLWPDLRSCLPDPRSEWPKPLSTVLERGLLWASARCWELSRHGRSSSVESSYLLRAAGPRLSKSSGFGKFRRTDFRTDFYFGADAGDSGLLAGWEQALSECQPPILETSQEGSAPLDRLHFGSASPRGRELLLLFFSSGGHSRSVAALPRAGWPECDFFRSSGGGGLIPTNGSASEYWADSPFVCPLGCSGVGAGLVRGVAKAFWKHWLREAHAASKGVGGIIRVADLCSTSWTNWRLRSWICFCISHSTWMANCWVKPRRGVSSTQWVSCPADVGATAPPSSGSAVTDTAWMVRAA